MRWEAEFGIAIPDEAVSSIRTPRQAVDYIFAQLPHATQAACLQQRAFYTVRRAFVDLLDLDRNELRPGTRLDHVIPAGLRRRIWRDLPPATGLEGWPPLQRTSVGRVALIILPLMAATAALLSFSILTATLAAAACAGFTAWVTSLRATRFPAHLPTLGGLASALVGPNARQLAVDAAGGWTRAQVRHRVRLAISEELGVAADFDDNADFVRDLGAT
jgi:hypothetical protein